MSMRFDDFLLAAIASFSISVGSSATHAQSIGLFFDPDGATCSAQAWPSVPVTLYIRALPGGYLGSTISSAEFRVDGLPSGWLVLEVIPHPQATVIGNPFQGGCNIWSPKCWEEGPVNLFTCTIWPTTYVTNVRLQVRQHTNPACPAFCCIHMVRCDPPIYTELCVAGGEALLNGGDCTVGISARSWSNIKNIFR